MFQINIYDKNMILSFKKRKRLDILIIKKVRNILFNYNNRNDITNLILNLKGIDFIDSASFKMLSDINMLSTNSRKQFYISNVSEELNELIHLVKMENILKTINIETILPKLAA